MLDENAVAAKHDIQVFSPGVEWYAEEILSGVPFTLVRYGEGEWRAVVPKVPHKRFTHPCERTTLKEIWSDDSEAREMLRESVMNIHEHERYWPAMWHFRHLKHYNWLPVIKRWQDKNLGEVVWHDGYVWRRAIEEGTFGYIVDALKWQRYPIVVVGPEELIGLRDRLPITHHILVDRWDAFHQMDEIEAVMREQPPSLFIICCAGPGKMLANKLFPDLGESSFLIDFGASWEGLLGFPARRYFKKIKHLERNWKLPEEDDD